MSFALDTNVLLYASDTGSPHHAVAASFLKTCAKGPGLVYVPWPVAMGYLRIATHPRIFSAPLSPRDAQRNLDRLLARPHVRPLGEREGFYAAYREVAGPLHPRGKLVTDTWIAAILKQHGVTLLYTNDRDFKRFEFLTAKNPFSRRSSPDG